VPLFLGYALVRVIPRPSHEKEIGGAKLRRDLRLALYSCLLYLAGMTAGFLFPRLGLFLYAAIPASYTISRLIDHKRGAAAR
jgi:hypothetical protein